MAVRKAEVLFVGDAASIVRAAQQAAKASERAAAAAKASASQTSAANNESAAQIIAANKRITAAGNAAADAAVRAGKTLQEQSAAAGVAAMKAAERVGRSTASQVTAYNSAATAAEASARQRVAAANAAAAAEVSAAAEAAKAAQVAATEAAAANKASASEIIAANQRIVASGQAAAAAALKSGATQVEAAVAAGRAAMKQAEAVGVSTGEQVAAYKAAAAAAVASAEKAAAAQVAALKRQKEALSGFAAGAVAGTKKAALGLVGLATASVYAAVKFGAHMRLIHTQAGASTAEVDKMSGAVLKLGLSTSQGPTKLAEALYHIESVGLRGKEALNALKAASEGASLGNADLEETTNAVSAAMVAFHTEGPGAAQRTMAILNATVGVGNTRMADLAAAMSSGILPTAKSVGLTMKDVGAAMATMTDAGTPAVQAANKLRTAFFLMAAPTSKAQTALGKIGLKQSDMAAEMRKPNGLVGALKLLRDHLGGLSKTQKVQTLAEAFGGSRSAATLVTLVDNLDRVQKKYKDIGKGTDKFAKDVAASHATAGHRIKVAWSMIQVAFIAAGKKLLPTVAGILGAVEKFVKQIESGKGAGGRFRDVVVAGFKKAKTAVTSIVSAVKDVVKGFKDGKTWAVALVGGLAGFATALTVIKAISVATKVWAAAQVLLNLAMATNPLVAVGTVIAVIVGALVALELKTHFVEKAWTKLKSAFHAVVSWIGGAAKKAFQMVKDAAHKGLLGPIPLIIARWDDVKDFIAKLPGRVLGFFKGLPGKMLKAGKDLINGLINGIKNKASHLIATIRQFVTDKIPSFVKKALGIKSPSRVFREIGEYIGQGLADGIRASAPMVAAATKSGLLFPLDGALAALNAQKEKIQAAYDAMDKMAQRSQLVRAVQSAKRAPVKSSGGGGGAGLVAGRGDSRIGVARTIVAQGKRMGASSKQILAALETGLVESNLRNLSYGDRDSVGVFQQRPSQGWKGLRNVPKAAAEFFAGAMKNDRKGLSAGRLAQSVQRSAFPGRYDQQHGQAAAILRAVGGSAGAASGGSNRIGALQDRIDRLEREKRNLPSGKAGTAQRRTLSNQIADSRAALRDAKGSDARAKKIRDAQRALREFDKEAARANKLAKIDLRIKGVEQVKAFKDAVAGVKDQLHSLAQQAADTFRKMREKQIGDAHDAAYAAVDGSAQAQELAALQATDAAEQDAKTQQQLNDDLATAKASHDKKAIKDAEDAIAEYKRQKREDELSAWVESEKRKADEAQTTAQNGLDQETADYQAALDDRLVRLTTNLGASANSYAEFVKTAQGILAPLGLSFAGSAGDEATVNGGSGVFAKGVSLAAGWELVRDDNGKVTGFKQTGHAAGGYLGTVGELGPEHLYGMPNGRVKVMPASQSGGARSGDIIQNFYGPIGSQRAARVLANRLAFRMAYG